MTKDVTEQDLLNAMKDAGIHHISLQEALQSPAVALALRNTALAAKKRFSRPVPPLDIKRIAAGDTD